MKRLALVLFACLALVGAGCGDSDDSSTSTSESTATSTESSGQSTTEESDGAEESSGGEKTKPEVTVPSGAPPKKLEINDLEKGTGATAKAGDEVTVQYLGVGYDSEEEFDSSWSNGAPFPLTLGAGLVIPGWEQGIEGMKVGGRRELTIPPNLAYGPAGSPPAIGPNETLIFVIDLLAIQ